MVNFSSIIPSIPFPNNLPLEIVLKTISSFFKFFEDCIAEPQPNYTKRKAHKINLIFVLEFFGMICLSLFL